MVGTVAKIGVAVIVMVSGASSSSTPLSTGFGAESHSYSDETPGISKTGIQPGSHSGGVWGIEG